MKLTILVCVLLFYIQQILLFSKCDDINVGIKILYILNLIYFQEIFLWTIPNPIVKKFYPTILIYFYGFYLLVVNKNNAIEKIVLTILSVLPHLYYEMKIQTRT